MNKTSGQTITWKKHIPFAGVLLLLFAAGPYTARQPWFDEVLTLDWLVYPFFEIPFKYTIPNNHIFYTLCLSLWKTLCSYFNAGGLIYLRSLSLAIGCCAVFLIGRRLRRAGGLWGGLPVIILLAGSGPMILFSTALRGYILSLLCCFAAFLCAESWMKHRRISCYILYAVFCYFSVWTIPTNILSAGAGLLFLLPYLFRKGGFRNLVILGGTLAGAFLLAYLPIFRKFLRVAALKEGWSSYPEFLLNYYGTLLIVFFPLILFCGAGFFYFFRKKKIRFHLFCFSVILLFPLLAGAAFQVAPFPRVFFPMYGLIALVLCYLLSGYLRCVRGNWKKLPLILSVVWLPVLPHISPVLSGHIFGGSHKDDLLYPYPVTLSFVPNKTAKRIIQAYSFENLEHVFIDFSADPPSIQFQLLQQNIPQEIVVKDRPDLGPVAWLDPRDWIICRDQDAFEKIRNRFSLSGEYYVLEESKGTFQLIYVPSAFFPKAE